MKIFVICGLFLFVILASGCATINAPALQKPIWEDTSIILRNIQGKTKDFSLQQIRDILVSKSSKLTTFRANVDLALTMPDVKGPIRCSGLIVYQSPRSFRILCSKFATTLFDMSSDGNKFWLHIPLENRVYTGASNTFHRIEALGINIFPGDMASLFNYREILEEKKTTLEIWPAYWLVHMLEVDKEDVNLKGNLLIDRVNAEVFRCELFNADGSIRLQAVFTNYTTQKECRIPQRIDVRWPAYDTTLAITFSNITVNSAIDPKLFTLSIPEGARVITLN
jgi:outer membrane lipoprotein-sorting protein